MAGKLGAPVISQGLTAGTSLLLQVVAARMLGLTEYGAFAVFLAVLVSATALYTGYVGDSLAVLDRRERHTRAALSTSALIALGLSLVIGIGSSLVLRPDEPVVALLYPVMLIGWLVEETFRRLLIARQEFWRLVVNDFAYLLGTFVALGAWYLSARTVTLPMIFGAMGVGTVAAIVTGFGQLPRAELRRLRPGLAGMREVASFAGWRSMHATLRPAALLASRLLVANLVSLTAVGLLEAGRLVIAPLQVVVNGAGSFLLAGFAAGERNGGRDAGKTAGRAAWLLAGVTLVGGAGLALFAGPLGSLLAGQQVDRLLVLGWVIYLGVWAAGLPYVTEVTARKLSRSVFWVRLADSAAGLVLVLAALLAGAPVTAVPWLMAAGGLYSVLRLRALAVRTRKLAPGPAVQLRTDLEATVRIPHV